MRLLKATGHVTFRSGMASQLHLVCVEPKREHEFKARVEAFVKQAWEVSRSGDDPSDTGDWSVFLEAFEADPRMHGLELGEAEQRLRSGNYAATLVEAVTFPQEAVLCVRDEKS